MSFKLNTNDILCIYGGTGSGKTTLFNILFGEHKNFKGNITIDSTALHQEKTMKNKVSFLFQESENQFVFPFIKDEYDFIISNSNDKSIRLKISEICEKFNVKLEDYFMRNFYELSAGERRIFQIAFCFSTHAKYLILDEPAEFLETQLSNILLNMIKTIKNKGILILTKYPGLYKDVCQMSLPLNFQND
ncbi:MAG: ATP-binding cassette domain-containing protein [Candidatus Cloacimonetes bacterium]|nr:ATP-binding cassette domain-containing protein [Candidatus Cloacimonadota bacterium]